MREKLVGDNTNKGGENADNKLYNFKNLYKTPEVFKISGVSEA